MAEVRVLVTTCRPRRLAAQAVVLEEINETRNRKTLLQIPGYVTCFEYLKYNPGDYAAYAVPVSRKTKVWTLRGFPRRLEIKKKNVNKNYEKAGGPPWSGNCRHGKNWDKLWNLAKECSNKKYNKRPFRAYVRCSRICYAARVSFPIFMQFRSDSNPASAKACRTICVKRSSFICPTVARTKW